MSTMQACFLLIAVFAARGTSFLFSKTLMRNMAPMGVLSVRFTLAFMLLALVFHRRLRACSRETLRCGLLLGVLYTICMTFEMFGLRLIDSAMASLIENMAIVLVPLYVAVLTRSLPKKKTMLCALLAVIGVGFLTLAQSAVRGGGWGIVLSVCAALTYGVCILATERVSRAGDPIAIGVIQMGTMGALCLLISLATSSFSLPSSGAQWLMLLMLVLLCSCFGFAFQPLGQKYLPAETAAVFTVVNPLTASILGVAVAGEHLTPFKLTGYALILAALLLYNLKSLRLD